MSPLASVFSRTSPTLKGPLRWQSAMSVGGRKKRVVQGHMMDTLWGGWYNGKGVKFCGIKTCERTKNIYICLESQPH